MRSLLTLLFLCALISLKAQDKDEQAIRHILSEQTTHWNKGDIDGFMNGYWKSDSLLFVGKSGPTYGYRATLNNYKKNYSDTVIMGKLHFDILKIQQLSANYYFVLGKWMLKRIMGDVGGAFTLLFKKINNQWVIVADHSS